MIIYALKSAWHFFWDTWRFVEREGRWKADQMHLDIIEAVLNQIPADIAETVRTQLDQRYFYSWMAQGRINVFFFYNEGSLPLIPDPAFEDRLFKVSLFIEDRKYVAHVSFFERRLYSVELKRPRSSLIGKSYRIGTVTLGKPSDSYIRVIDRAEHGKETDTGLDLP
ncbi:hypothetical protein [Erythrobacter sp. THAF29]|uniref:hypothetical protein n=1 Tax=Erythrobacter sp. THAF29 TaxID=2587851 RepID=UPI0012689AB4|nr:hypothetical protein [Erythrobacter sp. THAF29]QFT78733.1 hypothetical protein FIU90_14375 [Erythrobacter sp. THAF29]